MLCCKKSVQTRLVLANFHTFARGTRFGQFVFLCFSTTWLGCRVCLGLALCWSNHRYSHGCVLSIGGRFANSHYRFLTHAVILGDSSFPFIVFLGGGIRRGVGHGCWGRITAPCLQTVWTLRHRARQGVGGRLHQERGHGRFKLWLIHHRGISDLPRRLPRTIVTSLAGRWQLVTTVTINIHHDIRWSSAGGSRGRLTNWFTKVQLFARRRAEVEATPYRPHTVQGPLLAVGTRTFPFWFPHSLIWRKQDDMNTGSQGKLTLVVMNLV